MDQLTQSYIKTRKDMAEAIDYWREAWCVYDGTDIAEAAKATHGMLVSVMTLMDGLALRYIQVEVKQ